MVHVHSNYVYKTCSMHQYESVLLPPNFHHSSYFKPTNSKSEHPSHLLLHTVGASSTNGPVLPSVHPMIWGVLTWLHTEKSRKKKKVAYSQTVVWNLLFAFN